MDLTALRRRFGVVLQDPFLFTGTVESNIRLGTEWIGQDEVEKAAEEVNLADFIRTLPNGFKEEVRERGSTLSTGQKQLISFARALAHDPRFWCSTKPLPASIPKPSSAFAMHCREWSKAEPQ